MSVRQVILKRWQKGESVASLADELKLSVRTVRNWVHRFAERGQNGLAPLAPDYGRCATNALPTHSDEFQKAIEMRKQHPTWGGGLIRVLLQEQGHDGSASERTLQPWFQRSTLAPAPTCTRLPGSRCSSTPALGRLRRTLRISRRWPFIIWGGLVFSAPQLMGQPCILLFMNPGAKDPANRFEIRRIRQCPRTFVESGSYYSIVLQRKTTMFTTLFPLLTGTFSNGKQWGGAERCQEHRRGGKNSVPALLTLVAVGVAVAGQALAQDDTVREQAEAAVQRGVALHGKKDFKGAMAEFKKAVEFDPKYAPGYNGLGACLREQNDLPGAIVQLRKAIELDPKLAVAYRNLGDVLRRNKDLDGAVAAFRKAVEVRPDVASHRNNLAIALADKKDLDGAIAEYRKAVELDADFAPPHLGLGLALVAKKDSKQAIAAFRQAIKLDAKLVFAHRNLGLALHAGKDLDGAIAEFRKEVELQPNSAQDRHNLALALADKKDWDKSIAEYKKAVALNPRFSSQTYVGLGLALEATKDTAGAAASYRKAIEMNHPNARPHLFLGNILNGQGRFDEGIAVAEQGLKIAPQDAEVHNVLGACLQNKKRLPEAIAAYEKATRLDPKYASALHNLGRAYHEAGRFADAGAALQKLIELTPLDARAHASLGNALFRQQLFDKAIAAYQKSLDIDPRQAVVQGNLAIALQTQKRLPEAIAAHEKAAELAPKSAAAQLKLGLAYQAAGRFTDASSVFQKAAALSPKDTTALALLGNSLFQERRFKEVAEVMKKAVDINPRNANFQANLGAALIQCNDVGAAAQALRKAIELDPKYAQAHYLLGVTLRREKKWDDALAALHKSLELDPKIGLAYHVISGVFMDQKRWPEAEAALHKGVAINPKRLEFLERLGPVCYWQGAFDRGTAATQRAIELLPTGDPRLAMYQQRLKELATAQELDKRLPLVLEGKLQTGARELLDMARLCRKYKQHYRSAVQLYQEAFKDQPALLQSEQTLYAAARAAALAASGQGEQGGDLKEAEKAMFRRLAREWLEAALVLYASGVKENKLESVLQAGHFLPLWQKDVALAGLRDTKALARLLPEERQAWEKIWAEVPKTLKLAERRFLDTRFNTILGPEATSKHHLLEMEAGKTYVLDVENTAFNAVLKLELMGNLLATSTPVDDDTHTIRIIFTPTERAIYRLNVTSLWETDTGTYTLRMRQVLPADQ
jgi:tetratricopeptide (TPR) repeat protein/transposase